jgi:hypothetical protein
VNPKGAAVSLGRLLLFGNTRVCLHFDLRGITAVRWSRETVIGIVTRLRAGRPRNRGSIVDSCKVMSLLRNFETRTEAHPASSSVGTGIYFPRV